MASRRPGITIGNPPGYLGHEDDLYKVIGVAYLENPPFKTARAR